MLVVTSNWCVSDGTLSAGPPRRLIDRFRAEVRKASLRAGFRCDGSYRPVDAIDVVLAGDTFDCLISREWTGDVRPWDDGRRAAAARDRVVFGAIGRSHRLLATLAAWMRRGIQVPVADRRGRPMSTALRLVPVRVAVLRGDRDRWLEQAVSDWMHPARASMPMIGTCWSDGDVVVRHGEEIDPLHAACGSQPTLGESLAVDLIARFAAALDGLAGVGPVATGLVRLLAGGRFIDAPTRLVGWLSAHDCGAMLQTTLRQRLVDAWRRSVDLWHRAARQLPSGGVAGVDLVERIADWLDRAAGGDEQPPRPWCDAIPGSGVPLCGEAATTVLLGHPAAEPTASAAWRRQVVCLGPGALQPGDHPDDHLPAPAAVLVRPGREGRQIEWLPLDTVAATVGWQDDDHLLRGVWLSAVPRGVAGVVDAA
jgi:hypothetical protein